MDNNSFSSNLTNNLIINDQDNTEIEKEQPIFNIKKTIIPKFNYMYKKFYSRNKLRFLTYLAIAVFIIIIFFFFKYFLKTKVC